MFIICTQVLWAKQRKGRWVIWYRQRKVISKGWLVPVAKKEVALIKRTNNKCKTQEWFSVDCSKKSVTSLILIYSALWLVKKNARHLLSEPIRCKVTRVSRVWWRSRVFVWNCYWFAVSFTSAVIEQCNRFGLGFITVN